jgi:hypothetical protein
VSETVLWLLALQGALGAFDTLYFHEWKARLPAWPAQTAPELRLHASRDFLYALLFASLPWIAWQGLWAYVLAVILVAEIALTMTDFVVEVSVRRPMGDVYAGERVTHAAMGIVYGVMLAHLLPVLSDWSSLPTSLRPATAEGPAVLHWLLTLMAAGVHASGVRDLYASFSFPAGGWPWQGMKSISSEVNARNA